MPVHNNWLWAQLLVLSLVEVVTVHMVFMSAYEVEPVMHADSFMFLITLANVFSYTGCEPAVLPSDMTN